jgi:protein-disulfide isomerase
LGQIEFVNFMGCAMRSGVLKLVVIFLLGIGVVSAVAFGILKNSGKEKSAVSKQGELTSEDVEKIIAEYIQNNPQKIIDSVTKYQRNSAVEEEKRAQGNIKEQLTEIENAPSSPVAGNPKGDVTIVEFFDYSCGYCKKVLPAFAKIVEEDKNVRAVFKEFPILGPNSELAARAALSVYAIAPAKYFDFHKKLMDGHVSGQDSINSIAKGLGVDVSAMEAKMKSPEVEKTIAQDRALASAIGIHGTPAFIVGGQLVPGAVDYETFKSMVASARAPRDKK